MSDDDFRIVADPGLDAKSEWPRYRRREIRLRWAIDGKSIEVRTRRSAAWRKTAISKDLQFDVPGTDPLTLGCLIDNWSDSDEEISEKFDALAQASLGRKLYDELIGNDWHLRAARWLHLVPVASTDENVEAERERGGLLDFLLRIPWNYLTGPAVRDEPALLRGGAIVTLDANPKGMTDVERPTVYWPEWPKILLICTEADPEISGKAHRDELKSALTNGEEKLPEEYVKSINTFEEFTNDVKSWCPDLIYFYGHGRADDRDTRLGFDKKGPNGKFVPDDVGIEELRSALNRGGTVPLVWINACQGAAIQRNTVLTRLAPKASVVITSLAEVRADVARAIAMCALPKIVFDTAPPTVFREVIGDLDARLRSAGRWGRYVIGAQYGVWSNARRSKAEKIDPNWGGDLPNRLDRERVLAGIRENIEKSADARQSIVWYGDAEQAPKKFQDRLGDWLHEQMGVSRPEIIVVDLYPDSPPPPSNIHRFSYLLTQALSKAGVWSPAGTDIKYFETLAENHCSLVALMHGPFSGHHVEYLLEYMLYLSDLKKRLREKKVLIDIHDYYWLDQAVDKQVLDDKILRLECAKVTERQLRDHLEYGHPVYDTVGKNQDDLFGMVWSQSPDGSFQKMYEALGDLLGED
ncbi:hypothetical protein GOA63_15100 [Sinorhizobium meliloti]|uniref:hypothetical protein n=1 Tax=Rhizobium meliloti TaxID=382 RepID=UPI001297CCD4|nr:hypothetical protein [Sinorhizobium meliloti]MDW9593534.1 hypothetical protein [Sinorhizobium meliloti]MDX0191718.1 hypothetical protein [Sinorhizobium meliloti]MQV09056.1 hypothetical protein [Sinorhizobium meliloti]